MEGVTKDCAQAGMDDYISKPFTISELLKVVEPGKPIQTAEDEKCESSSGILDKDYLFDQVCRDEAVFKKIVALMLESLPIQLENLETEIEHRDPDKIRNSAHALKGSLGSLGAQLPIQLTEWIEYNTSADISVIEDKMKKLKKAINTLIEELVALNIELS